MGPVNRLIFSRCTKRSTSCLAWSGLPAMSAWMNSAACPPSLPPSSLMARLKPSRASVPAEAKGPEMSSAMPTLIGSAANACVAQAATSTAEAPTARSEDISKGEIRKWFMDFPGVAVDGNEAVQDWASTPTSTRPARSWTGKLRTAWVTGPPQGLPVLISNRPWCKGHSMQPFSI